MPKIEKHADGSFCWMELATTDQAGAKQFYPTLFGWETSDFPMGPNEYYTMFKLGGGDAGAAYTMREEERKMAPPHWNLYIQVADADRAAKRAAELGGTVVAGPFDVMTFGRMAVILDPAGAAFCIWQPMQNPGTTVTAEPGTVCWADLYTPNADRAKQFYEGLFGWSMEPGKNDPAYLHIKNGDEFIGGVPTVRPGEMQVPPSWNLYFHVTSCEASTAKAKELGAKVYEGPATIENVGRFSVVADPQGAVFSLFEPATR
ncbi:MAG: VOC family protein [Acidobacteriia bacterium]|nr:VOC family protein [Terriglobia bacterium]